jgi:hypothetical protein
MALRLARPPDLVRDALVAGMRRSGLAEGVRVAGRRWQPEQIEVPRPVPMFVSDVEAAAVGQLLEDSRPAGWMFLVFESEFSVAFAEVRQSGDGAPRLLSVSRSTFSAAASRALHRAVAIVESEPSVFDLRLFRVPELHLMAVWLHGDSADWLIPLPPAPFGLPALEPVSGEEMTELLQARAADQLTRPSPP